jgi:hypothetical protein
LQQSAAAYEGIGYRSNANTLRWMSAYAARGLGEVAEARRLVAEGILASAVTWDLTYLIEVLPAAALCLLDEGAIERAVEVYELARTLPVIGNSAWVQDVAGKPIAEAAKGLPFDVVAAARERGRARDMLATCRELAEEFGGPAPP